MNRILILLIVLSALALLGAQTITGTAPPTDQSVYQQTLDKLLPKVQAGVRNADLYYNLGVCFYHTGNTGKAALFFLRALNLDSAHRAARENLIYIQSLDPEAVKAPSRPFLTQLLLNIYDFFTLNRLAFILLVLGLICTLSLHWLLHYPQDKERGLPVLLLSITLFLFLLVGGTLLVKHHRYSHNAKAVVMTSTADVYHSVSGGKAERILPEGSIVEIRSDAREFSQVILADGTSGWIKTSSLERVIPLN